MKIGVAREIVRVGEEAGWDVELMESYSGRGMQLQGKKTAAVVVDKATTFAAVVGLACQQSEIANAIVETVKSCQQDRLGFKVIFY